MAYAEQKLKHRHAANVLRAMAMLRPAERIHTRHGPLAIARRADHLGGLIGPCPEAGRASLGPQQHLGRATLVHGGVRLRGIRQRQFEVRRFLAGFGHEILHLG